MRACVCVCQRESVSLCIVCACLCVCACTHQRLIFQPLLSSTGLTSVSLTVALTSYSTSTLSLVSSFYAHHLSAEFSCSSDSSEQSEAQSASFQMLYAAALVCVQIRLVPEQQSCDDSGVYAVEKDSTRLCHH